MPTPTPHTRPSDLSDSGRGSIIAGVSILTLFFGGLGTWAAVAPLAGAVVALGSVAVEDNRKTVKHHGGGVVASLHVKEGDRVTQGTVLIRLDDTEARSTLERLKAQRRTLLAQRARLRAEAVGQETIPFPPALTEADDSQASEIIALQTNLMQKRRRALTGKVAVFQQRIRQLHSERNALVARRQANRELLASTIKDLQGIRHLAQRGFATRRSLRDAERRAIYLEGQIEETTAEIRENRETVAQTRFEIDQLHAERAAEVADGLNQVETRLAEVVPALAAAAETFERTVVRAPVAGTVLGLRAHTVGGVVEHGEPILEIVPDDEPLIVTARIQPRDIDEMHPGLAARIRITAYERLDTPQIDGIVRRVSADAFADTQAGTPFFLARIAVDRAALAANPAIRLHPGMPAEVIIPTTARTALDYLLSPLLARLGTAFRER